ncbi:SGNH/GDSL hydrolase family protein [Nocardiopsis sp. CNT-189]|uniref:SGNH/GDSL hydrolase family protein n=1 Tax=Nocardiopsis oceanisediminis TaxID=2816862 RepID=UPI003B2D83F8
MTGLDLDRSTLTYVAIGDSFTEGVGDPGPDGRFRGWADRFAEHLAGQVPEVRYANLAVRGKLIRQIITDQLPRALELRPDLATLCAGGNDLLRPGARPEPPARILEHAVRRLRAQGTEVVLFTGVNIAGGYMRARIGLFARFYLDVRSIADRYGCHLVDQWSMTALTDPRAWDADRLHMSPEGHRRLALKVCRALGVPADGDPDAPWPPVPPSAPGRARRENLRWAREYLVPWIGRRLTGRSSGDGVTAKRPDPAPVPPAAGE